MESDWRKFRDMVPMLRDRYLKRHIPRLASVLVDPQVDATERFWAAFEGMEHHAKVLRMCLIGHSRSKMWMFLELMIRHGMLLKEDLDGFSAELRADLEPLFDERRR